MSFGVRKRYSKSDCRHTWPCAYSIAYARTQKSLTQRFDHSLLRMDLGGVKQRNRRMCLFHQ